MAAVNSGESFLEGGVVCLVWVWFGFANNFIYFYAVLISRVFFVVVVVNLHHTLLDPRGESADL